MLSIGKMVARSGEYYIATVANGREEYYTGSGESPGFWLGEGARHLGLEGFVDPDDLRSVLAGVSPEGEILTAGRVDEAKRVAGFDLTWSAPKSVSLLFGLSDPAVSAVVRGVHEDAVEQALGYLQRHALRVRRGTGGENSVGAEGLVAAAFTHRTSRAGDPQLHTHVLVANVAKGVDGIWSAPSSRLLYNHSRTAGFLYQSAVRAGLTTALGVRFGEVSRGMAELDGVPKALLRAFSTRRREIEHQMAATGATSARSAEVAALATRSAKDAADASATTMGLRQRWLAQVDGLGLTPTGDGGPLDHLLGAGPWRPPSTSEVNQLLDRLAGPEGLTAGHSAFERRDVARLVAEGLPGGPGCPTSRCWPNGSSSVQTSSPWQASAGEARSVTPRSRCWKSSASSSTPPAGYAKGAGALPIERTWSRPSTTSVCCPTNRPRWWPASRARGQAWRWWWARLGPARPWPSPPPGCRGNRAASVWSALPSQPGRPVVSATGRHRLADVGVAAGRHRIGRTALSASYVVVLDEAGMVGTRALARLVESADDAGAKVVLVGDPRQLPEIEAGGALAGLINRVGATELTENRRQQSSWERVALDALRMGRANVALATYERAGRIHAAPTVAEAQSALIERWAESFCQGDDAVMLAASRTRRGDAQRAGPYRTAPLGTPRQRPARGRWSGVRRGRQGDLSAQRPASRRDERHDRHRRVSGWQQPRGRNDGRSTDLAGRVPRGRSPGPRLCTYRPQVPGHDGRARLRALERVAQPRVGLRGHEQSDAVDRALVPLEKEAHEMGGMEQTHDPRAARAGRSALRSDPSVADLAGQAAGAL